MQIKTQMVLILMSRVWFYHYNKIASYLYTSAVSAINLTPIICTP